MVAVAKYLQDYEQALLRRIAHAEQALAELRSDLDDTRKAMGAVAGSRPEGVLTEETADSALEALQKPSEGQPRRSRRRYLGSLEGMAPANYSIMDMVINALSTKYQDGTTAQSLLEHFKVTWGRNIARTSLSPQLTRLKRDGVIDLDGNRWFLTKPQNEEASADRKSAEASR